MFNLPHLDVKVVWRQLQSSLVETHEVKQFLICGLGTDFVQQNYEVVCQLALSFLWLCIEPNTAQILLVKFICANLLAAHML